MLKPFITDPSRRDSLKRSLHSKSSRGPRTGKIIVLFAFMLPVLFGIVGLVFDGGLLIVKHRGLQHIVDASASAAALDRLRGATTGDAIETARAPIELDGSLANADVIVNIPPGGGDHAGNTNYVEVIVARTVQTHFIQMLGRDPVLTVRARAVAGYEPATTGAAIVVLDPRPPAHTISADSPLYSSLAASSAGLEILGGGKSMSKAPSWSTPNGGRSMRMEIPPAAVRGLRSRFAAASTIFMRPTSASREASRFRLSIAA